MHSITRASFSISAASLAAALFAHALLQRIAEAGLGATAFEDHAHGSVAPAMAVVAALFVLGVASFASDAIQSRTIEPFRRVKRLKCRELAAIGTSIAVIASLSLFGMEYAESSSSALHFGWLGGNLLLGLAVLLVATLASTGAVKLVSDTHRVALDRAIALLSKIVRAIAERPIRTERFVRFEAPRVRVRGPFVARNTGLRAPPLSTI